MSDFFLAEVNMRRSSSVLIAYFTSVGIVSLFALPALAQALNMSYDQLGRLTQVTYPGGVVIGFAYDAAGNRTSYVVTGSPNAVPPAPTPIGTLKVDPSKTLDSSAP
jgi:YD repeat-containing protein